MEIVPERERGYEVLDECNVIGNIFDNPELIKEI